MQIVGYLYAATAAAMLAGDVLVGRFVTELVRDRLLEPLRFLHAAPYLVLLAHPPLALAAALVGVASVGYAATLPLQERIVIHTQPDVRGQALGINAAGTATGLTAAVSLIPGLRRTRGRTPVTSCCCPRTPSTR